MKKLIMAALLLATFTVEADAGLLQRLFGGNKATTKQVTKTRAKQCRIVNGVRTCR